MTQVTTYDMIIHSNPDAKAWAEFYAKHFDSPDVETMTGWFANAMMAMHDHIKQITPPATLELDRLRRENGELRGEVKALMADTVTQGRRFVGVCVENKKLQDELSSLRKRVEEAEARLIKSQGEREKEFNHFATYIAENAIEGAILWSGTTPQEIVAAFLTHKETPQ